MANNDNERNFSHLCELIALNDEDVRFVHTSDFGPLQDGYGERLGQALLFNTNVTSLSLSMSTFLSIDDANTDKAFAMLEYIRTSPYLERVGLVTPEGHPLSAALIELIINAMAQNPFYIDSFDAQVQVPPRPLANLLRQTTSLTNMYVYLDGCVVPSDQHYLAVAFGANTTLQDLSLGSTDGGESHRASELIFEQLALQTTHSQLSQIMIGMGDNARTSHFEALAQFLAHTKSLEHLDILDYSLDTEAVRLICQALQSNPVITKLSLAGCQFDEDSTRDLLRFMQDLKRLPQPEASTTTTTDGIEQPKTTTETEVIAVRPVLVDELYIRPLRTAQLFGDWTIGRAAAEMLVDSSLRQLTLAADVDTMGFFETLIDNQSSRILLPSLWLDHVTPDEAHTLARYLPTSATLQHLRVSRIDDSSAIRRRLLSAIRHNGSLHHVDIATTRRRRNGEDVSLFDRPRSSRRRLDAYLERNQRVPLLLARPRLFDNQELAADTDAHDQGDNNDRDDNYVDMEIVPENANDDENRTNLMVFPDLFVSGLPAPRTAPNWVLIGLLATAARIDVIGPDE